MEIYILYTNAQITSAAHKIVGSAGSEVMVTERISLGHSEY